MKIKFILTSLICLFVQLTFGQQKLAIHTKTSIINWTGHAEIGTYAPAGTLAFKEGSVTTKASQIISANLTIDMQSMKQENENLIGHLKSADFFDVDKYPVSTIRISKIVNGKAYGTLTIKNKTLPFSCPILVKKDNGETNITGSTVIDRTAYGITYNSGSFFSGLGDKAIKNTFDISFSIWVPFN